MFSCEYCESFKNTLYFQEHLRRAASYSSNAADAVSYTPVNFAKMFRNRFLTKLLRATALGKCSELFLFVFALLCWPMNYTLFISSQFISNQYWTAKVIICFQYSKLKYNKQPLRNRNKKKQK